MDKVAIVILNWNGRKMLEKYLPSVMQYSRDEATVYVADNASTDDSLEFMRKHYPEVKLIVLEKNWGFAEGYNKALAQIEAEYYLLLNSDIEVTHHWLTPMIEYLDAHQDVAACQPKLLSVFDKDQFEYAGASGGYLDAFGYPFCRGRIFETVEADNGQYDDVADILWATGAALMIRSKDYWDVKGLDARFFAHNEEIDMCWRLRIKGRRIVCIPDSRAFHVGGGTLPGQGYGHHAGHGSVGRQVAAKHDVGGLADGHLGSIEVGAHVAVAHSTGGDAQLEVVHPAAAPLHPGLV